MRMTLSLRRSLSTNIITENVKRRSAERQSVSSVTKSREQMKYQKSRKENIDPSGYNPTYFTKEKC